MYSEEWTRQEGSLNTFITPFHIDVCHDKYQQKVKVNNRQRASDFLGLVLAHWSLAFLTNVIQVNGALEPRYPVLVLYYAMCV